MSGIIDDSETTTTVAQPKSPMTKAPAPAAGTPSIREANAKWINNLSLNTGKDENEIAQLLEDAFKKNTNDVSIDDALDTEDLMEMSRSDVVRIISIEVSTPTKQMDFMYIGHYKSRQTTDGSIVTDMIGWACDSENPDMIYPARVSAWNKDIELIADFVPFTLVTGKFGYSSKNNPVADGMYNLTLIAATNPQPITQMGSGESIVTAADARKAFEDSYPLIKIEEMGDNLSPQLTDEKGKSFVNTLELRRMKVQVSSFREGVNEEHGTTWGMYGVVDSTFVPTEKLKNISVWIDPEIVRKADAGEKSTVELYGYISRNKKTAVPEMTACGLIVKKKVPIQSLTDKINSQGKAAAPGQGAVDFKPTGGLKFNRK